MLQSTLDPMPTRMAKLRVDPRGYPVPWFVEWFDGPDGPKTIPDFRVMDTRKWQAAVTAKLCWVCGDPLGAWLAFAIGPMCAVNRTTSEPPAHRECAEWSIRNCPFLSNPHMIRRTNDLPVVHEKPGGHMLTRNPGVMCLWMTRSYEVFNAGQGKPLITIGEPTEITWWREGTQATRAAVIQSIDGGMPALMGLAKAEGMFAVKMLGRSYDRLQPWLPKGLERGDV